MRRLLAVGVTGPWTGDWHPVAGNEKAFAVHGAGDDGELELSLNAADGKSGEAVTLYSGLNYVVGLSSWARYRVSKRAGLHPTTVEVILNGAP